MLSAPPPLAALQTPTALLDEGRLARNILAMQARADRLGVRLRPHVKTSKSLAVVERQLAAGARGITVSTMREAEAFFAAGIDDIVYAVGIAPNRFAQAMALQRAGCRLKLITDNVAIARLLAQFGVSHGHRFDLLVEIDSDGHRAGVKPDAAALLDIARASAPAGRPGFGVAGVITHAGSSYACDTPDALLAMAALERDGCVAAATRLRDAGFACPVVSVGATPTACVATDLGGVTEMRPGVYVFNDLVMANIGVCGLDDIALSVLTTVIGHQPEKDWAIVDAGWMAMSRDLGTARQRVDYGYGQVCDADGRVMPGLTMTGANQEHGIVSRAGGPPTDGGVPLAQLLPVGTLLRLLPNHACATATQFDEYRLVAGDGRLDTLPRFRGW